MSLVTSQILTMTSPFQWFLCRVTISFLLTTTHQTPPLGVWIPYYFLPLVHSHDAPKTTSLGTLLVAPNTIFKCLSFSSIDTTHTHIYILYICIYIRNLPTIFPKYSYLTIIINTKELLVLNQYCNQLYQFN